MVEEIGELGSFVGVGILLPGHRFLHDSLEPAERILTLLEAGEGVKVLVPSQSPGEVLEPGGVYDLEDGEDFLLIRESLEEVAARGSLLPRLDTSGLRALQGTLLHPLFGVRGVEDLLEPFITLLGVLVSFRESRVVR